MREEEAKRSGNAHRVTQDGVIRVPILPQAANFSGEESCEEVKPRGVRKKERVQLLL